ncbi:MAG: glycosyltransferase [Bacteroidetes bacterium]|nr:glycosyltransferase [Bacteroidota bacterium]MBU1114864.1 glycosyltransferase [Bacteroidota bacterium]MBU1798025.1 glycosyltransferase [Bacteroidota bacterium]
MLLSKNVKVLFIAFRHSIDDARVFHKEAMSLFNKGFDISLLSRMNNEGEFTSFTGKIYAKSDSKNSFIDFNGIKLWGIKQNHRKFLKSLLRLIFLFKAVKKIAQIKPQIIHVHEFDLALLSSILYKIFYSRSNRIILIHDMHEFPGAESYDNIVKSKINFVAPISKLINFLWCKYSLLFIDHVFTANTIVRGYVLSLNYNISVDVLFNVPKLEYVKRKAISLKKLNVKRKLVICHEGSLGKERGLGQLLEIMSKVKDIAFLKIIGDIYLNEKHFFEKKIEEFNLEGNVIVTGWLKYEKVFEEMENCDIGLVLFLPTKNNRLAGPPNKLFNYMLMKLYIISTDLPETRLVLNNYKTGSIIDISQIDKIVTLIRNLNENPEVMQNSINNASMAISQYLNWSNMEKIMLNRYEEFSKCVD